MTKKIGSIAAPAKLGLVFSAAMLIQCAPAFTAELPTRQSGLWEQKTVHDEGSGPKEYVLKICIDRDMEEKTARAAVNAHRANCEKYEIKSDAGTTTVEASCVFRNAPVTSTTSMSGDFTKEFSIRIKSETVVQNRGQSTVVRRTIDQEGTYLGTDCGGLKPGEAMGTDGKKVVVQ